MKIKKSLLLLLAFLFGYNSMYSRNEESFDVFFVYFSENKTNQISRISFPLKYYSEDESGNSFSVINKEQWEFIDFKNDYKAKKNKVDAYRIDIKKQKNIVIYKRIGIDNGILIEFIFCLSKGKWFLQQVNDKST